jgi:hypothetical protein
MVYIKVIIAYSNYKSITNNLCIFKVSQGVQIFI